MSAEEESTVAILARALVLVLAVVGRRSIIDVVGAA